MPQRAKSRLGRPQRRSMQPASVIARAVPAVAEDVGVEPKRTGKGMCNSEARLELYARLAWMPEYSAVYELEAEINGAAAAVEHYLSDHRR